MFHSSAHISSHFYQYNIDFNTRTHENLLVTKTISKEEITIIRFFNTLLCLLLIFTPLTHIFASESWTYKLDKILNSNQDLQGAIVGISIRSAQTGEIIYQHNGDIRLRPASNMKLLTSAAALHTLGEEHTLETKLLSDGEVSWRGLRGNLYIKGMGDPTLMKSDIDNMVQNLKQKGIKYIFGDIIADDTWFDDVRYSIDLPWSDETAHYGAQISALTISPDEDYDSGTVKIEIQSAKQIDKKPTINIQPDNNYIEVINQIKTVDKTGKKEIFIKREHGTNTIVLEGTSPVKTEAITYNVAVWEPTGLVLELLQQSLKEHGVIHIGKTNIGVTPDSAHVLITHHSKPIAKILVPFMKRSNNAHGEILVKEMGKRLKGEGSWECGLEVVTEALKNWGLNTDIFVIRDGTGISHVNAITTNELSKLLYEIQNESWFPEYFDALPIAGVDGTLQNRLKDSLAERKVFAKTGTLNTVSSLSGYVHTNSGETLIFSIILNQLLDNQKGKEIEDQIAIILAGT